MDSRLAVRHVASGAVLALALSVVAMGVTAAEPKQWTDTDVGLTDAQREQNYAAGRSEFQARYEQWLAQFVGSGRDPRALPKRELAAIYTPPKPDLATAVDAAELIVVGNTVSVRFEATTSALVTFAVEQVLKGVAGPTVTIQQAGGPMPDRAWGGGTLAIAANAPLLLPGDRAILFLHRDTGGTYYVQSFTGMYRIENGVTDALEGNPFLPEVDGLPDKEMILRILEEVVIPGPTRDPG